LDSTDGENKADLAISRYVGRPASHRNFRKSCAKAATSPVDPSTGLSGLPKIEPPSHVRVHSGTHQYQLERCDHGALLESEMILTIVMAYDNYRWKTRAAQQRVTSSGCDVGNGSGKGSVEADAEYTMDGHRIPGHIGAAGTSRDLHIHRPIGTPVDRWEWPDGESTGESTDPA
jgi:hypothetical protein